jgi:membrane-associated phospholipid phosphatase
VSQALGLGAGARTAALPSDGFTWVTGVADRAPSWFDGVVTVWTTYGVVVFGLLLAVGWWTARGAGDRRRVVAALCAPITTLLAIAASALLKPLFAEARPCLGLPPGTTLLTCPPAGDYSFPSNHAVMAGAVAVALVLVNRRLGLIATIAALVMAASRVWTGQHYPHDVAAGLALGAVIAGAGYLLLRAPLSRLTEVIATTRLHALVTPDAGHLDERKPAA